MRQKTMHEDQGGVAAMVEPGSSGKTVAMPAPKKKVRASRRIQVHTHTHTHDRLYGF